VEGCSRLSTYLRWVTFRSRERFYGERGSPKYEKAALRWLERYLFEEEPSLERFASVVYKLARRAE